MSNYIFALDIGTRIVVGIVAVPQNDRLKILAVEQMEHTDRVMFDGQIHDIGKVSDVINKIKSKLEKKLGIKLANVCLAAAGRSLKTQTIRAEKYIKDNHKIEDIDIDNLLLDALNISKKEISKKTSTVKYYMVGYSISNYYLDGLPITNLKGHIGHEIAIEIISTFLPYDVVESLYAAAKNANLNVEFLTLEPIAAISVAILPKIRMLNIALVDIGAGTSDIAISRDGNIIAYSMVPYAGDEITESLSKHYLTDFKTAEKIKIDSKNEIIFKDVIGIEHKVKKSDVYELIKPQINYLSKKICNEIIKYNGKSPSAVFLVGGSSNLKNIALEISNILSIPYERVSVRNINTINVIEYKGRKLKGPECITPIGIAYSAMLNKKDNYINIIFNDKNIKLLNIKKNTILDVLLKVNFDAKKLMVKDGKNLCFILNGKEITINADIGIPAKIYRNGIPSNLKTTVYNNDKIEIKNSIHGKDAMITISEIKSKYKLTDLIVNGNIVDDDYIIKNGDIVKTKILDKKNNEFYVFVNGNKVILTGKEQYIFVDVFNFMNFELPKNKLPEMMLNGHKASYTDVLIKGDKIEIIV